VSGAAGRALRRAGVGLGLGLSVGVAKADVPVSPWVEDGEVPFQAWARSVVPRPGSHGQPGDMVLFQGPERVSSRRGVTAPGASLPVFGAKRGTGCAGKWWLVGPMAWTCSDGIDLSPADPVAPERAAGPDGLLWPYYFVRKEGASAYQTLDSAEEGASDRELEGGWAVAIVEQQSRHGERWGLTRKGIWISMRDLGAARPTLFRGATLAPDAPLDVAWILAEHANVWSTPAPKGKPADTLVRFQLVHAREDRGTMVRISEDGSAAAAERWVAARDIARPRVVAPPAEVTHQGERWIDVDLASQTLLAYEGTHPVYATLVSTGRGARGSGSETPTGVHRIWVKILASDMDNAERDDLDSHYSMEDVPYVQFFDNAVALHGTYWHHDFGHTKSHGCVNLAPLDARWLFDFTGPRLPTGWVAAYPTAVDPGAVVRVR
jgi:lipoprotein-anchoring transpeptidase ErfK/SrfK